MKKIALLLALASLTTLTQAQDTFVETPDHRLPVAQEWQSVHGSIRAAWGSSDVRYAEHITFMGDAKIILRTLSMVLMRDGIRAEGSATMPRFTGRMSSTEQNR